VARLDPRPHFFPEDDSASFVVAGGGGATDVPVMVSALGDAGVRLVPLRAINVSPKGTAPLRSIQDW
jgi:phosphoribosylcarboxyaminoimidazole (NCAIR) mutase